MVDEMRPIWIDSASGVAEAADRCTAAGRFALDTEADSMHAYFHKVCLIQVTADEENMIIDPLALEPGDLNPLWEVVGDPVVPVLMHGSDYDIRILDRDYGARVAGLEDTQVMALLLGEEKTGLAALLDKELGVVLDKRFQRADWGRRPLKRAQLIYGAADTAHLMELTSRLRRRLEDEGRWHWAEEEFRKLEGVRHHAVEPDPYFFERIKGARALRGADRDRLFSLHQWRDLQARKKDVPPFKVIGNKPLILLATESPSNLDDLADVDGVGPNAVRRWGREILRLLRRPEIAPERIRLPRVPTPEAAVRKRAKELTAVRDARAGEVGLQAGLLCPRATLDVVAARQPVCASLDDLADAGLKGWRLEVLGESYLKALSES
jgi:ribonuclease D